MRVSVVIPSYNHHQYVLQAIESVLNQSYENIDLIVIDDGSTDGSAKLIADHHRATGGYRFIARENRGLIKTLNEGLNNAEGAFFCELASDDYFPEDSVDKRVSYLKKHPEHVAVFADGSVVLGRTETTNRFLGDKRRMLFSLEDPIPAMLEGVLPVFSTGMIRTEILRLAGGFDEENFRYYEDLDTPFRLLKYGRFGFLDAAVIFRRGHETNVSSTTPHIRFEKVFLYQKLLKNSELFRYRKSIKKMLFRSYLLLARQLKNYSSDLFCQGVKVLSGAWRGVFKEPRLLWYLLKYRIL